eukprot:PLAT7140.1.p1 GENE.PLAT7140.1~~PLAT7140.1.p1  ORF type:complete len:251 (-),score=109.33 PLAT7140.1:40-792(-)
MSRLEEAQQSESSAAVSLRELLTSKHYRRPLEIGVVLMLIQQFSGITGVVSFAEAILDAAGLPVSQALIGISGVAAAQVVATLPSVALLDRAGRVRLMQISLLGQALSMGTLALFFHLQAGGSKPPPMMAVASLVGYIVAFSMGTGPVPWVVMAEVCPQRTRGITSSIATATNWLSAFIVGQTFLSLQTALSAAGAFLIFIVVCLLGIIYVTLRMPETKGLTLEQVGDLFAEDSGSKRLLSTTATGSLNP